MSIQFSDTSTYKGLIQFIERTLGFPRTYISGNADRLLDWTAELNLALDKVFHVIFKTDGRWQFDDSNHTTYPILTGNLEDGQRDYSFTTDSDSNLILAIQRVFVRTSATTAYYEIYPVDVQTAPESEILSFVDGLNTEGIPYSYDKTATGIFLDPIPKADVTAGLKIYVSREGSYFDNTTTGWASKKAGFAGLYHEYLILDACYRYARANDLQKREVLKRDLLELKKDVEEFYAHRSKDERNVITMEPIIYM